MQRPTRADNKVCNRQKSTKYYIMNGKLIQEDGNNRKIIYLYDSTGIVGCIINDVSYYYMKNIFGDVVGLYNLPNNRPMARYDYDAWGNWIRINE